MRRNSTRNATENKLKKLMMAMRCKLNKIKIKIKSVFVRIQ